MFALHFTAQGLLLHYSHDISTKRTENYKQYSLLKNKIQMLMPLLPPTLHLSFVWILVP